MQDELTTAGLDVTLFGINGQGFESGNAAVCAGRDIGWLQETSAEPAWQTWGVTYRDVIILDDENRVFAIYNVTQHDLQNPTNFVELRGLFEAAANAP